MKTVFPLLTMIISLCVSHAQTAVVPNVWINELHYDDVAGDTLEGFEIAGPVGTDLSCYRVYLYNGFNNSVYMTDTLSGVITDLGCGYGTIWFGQPQDGVQNGAPDGIVLEYAPFSLNCGVGGTDTILQFLSYEGAMTATSGRAAGLTSIDIGITEGTSTPDSASMQLTGFGTTYADFTWVAGLANSHDAINVNQTFCPPPPTVQFAVSNDAVSESFGVYNVTVSLAYPNSNPTSVDIVVTGGTATNSDDYTFSPTTLTFPANSSASQVVAFSIVDDIVDENNETVFITLSNPTNGANIGSIGIDTLTIFDDDGLGISIYPHTQSQFENIGTINVPVLLNNQSSNSTSVLVKLVSSTATQGIDYFFNDTTITWPAGTSGTIQVPVQIVDDNLYEADETISIIALNPTNGAVLTDSTFLITILNNDNLSGSDCSDLYFSEYIEGSASNKALEIYNPTTSTINLSDYSILLSTNGALPPSEFRLTGLLAPDDVYVLVGSQSDSLLKLKADTLTSFINHNGNDAYALVHITDTIDAMGVLGVNPGGFWIVDTATTQNHTLIRSPYYYIGDKDWNNSVESWRSYPIDLFDSLGFHNTAPCGSPEPVTPATVRFITAFDSVPEIYTPNFNYHRVVVQCINPSGQNCTYTVAFDPAQSTAVQGFANDFAYTNSTFTAGPGTTFDTIDIIIVNDNLIEPTENALFRFINLSPNVTTGSDSIYNLYITDTDVLSVSFLGASYDYLESSGQVSVKVILSTPVPSNTSVSVTQAAGSATPNVDFTFSDTTLTFQANSSDTLSFLVNIIEDGIDEGNEEINFDLVNPTNGAILGINGCTVRIIDNDSTVGIWNNSSEQMLRIYPNPAQNTLFIEAYEKLDKLFITDLVGHTVYALDVVTQGKFSIELTELPEGMYFVSLQKGLIQENARFIIQR